MKVCFISTAGGHLAQLAALARGVEDFDRYLVTVPSPHAEYVLPQVRKHFVRQILRNPANFVVNFLQSLRILLRERPDAVVTTGAGDALPTVMLASAIGTRVAFLESLARVNQPSLFGRIAHRWCDVVFVQWAGLKRAYPRATLVSPVFRFAGTQKDSPRGSSVFVMTGTHTLGFDRLLSALDRQVAKGLYPGPLFAQTGHSAYVPRHFPSVRFLPHEDLLIRLREADVVVTHDGAGSIGEALSAGKPTVVVPRRPASRETTYESGQELAHHLASLGLVRLVEDPEQLPSAVREASSLVPPVLHADLPEAQELLRNHLIRWEGSRDEDRRSAAKARQGPSAGADPILAKLKVAIVAPANPWEPRASGIRTYTEALLAHLATTGAEVAVATPGKGPTSIGGSIRFFSLGPRAGTALSFLARLALLGPRLRDSSDTVHLQRLDHVLPLLPWVRGKMVLVTLHGDSARSVGLRRGRFMAATLALLEGLASFFVDRLIAVDDTIRRTYEARYTWLRGKIEVIPVGFWPPDHGRDTAPSEIAHVPADAKIVLFAGRLVPEKNLRLLVESFVELVRQRPESFLVVVGDGPDEKNLKAWIQASGVQRFLHLPTLERSQFLALARRADLLTVTSALESGPLVSLEAICQGTPVVSAPVGRVADLVAKWGVGAVSEPNPRSFAAAMAQVLERGREHYRNRCRELARTLSFDTTFRATALVYASKRSRGG